MSIEWISVDKRVPDNRRRVLTWGYASVIGYTMDSCFLGDDRFNPTSQGGRFDNSGYRRYGSSRTVTHWAEITGPAEPLPAAPPKAP